MVKVHELVSIFHKDVHVELIDSHEVSNSSTWAHLAMSGDQLFIRDLQGIQALTWNPR